MEYNVYKGEYPFDEHIGVVVAENAEEALAIALHKYGNHPVVSPRPQLNS